jgi:hypothetical protein
MNRFQNLFEGFFRPEISLGGETSIPKDDKSNKEDEIPNKKIKVEDSFEQSIDFDNLFKEQSKVSKRKQKTKVIDIFKCNPILEDFGSGKRDIAMRKKLLMTFGEKVEGNSSKPIRILNRNEANQLFIRLSMKELIALFASCPEWPYIKEFLTQIEYFWFSQRDSLRRFYPTEDCCDVCRDKFDEKWCIKVNQICDVITVLSGLTETHLPHLRCLRLYRFSIDSDSMEDLAKLCPNLLHMDLTESEGFTIDFVKTLGKLYKNLEHLILASTKINEIMLSSIIHDMRSLKTLVVNRTYITGKSLKDLPKSIETIDMRCCPELNPQELMNFSKENFQKLRYIKTDALFNEEAFTQMCSSFSALILLELNDSTKAGLLKGKELAKISNLLNLQSLKFDESVDITQIELSAIFRDCPFMRSFSLNASKFEPLIKDDIMSQISDYWPLLQNLELICLNCVRNKTLKALSKLENLSHLNLTECTQFDEDCIYEYLSEFQNLYYLVLDKCSQLSKRTLDEIIRKAERMGTQIFYASLLRCNIQFFPYLKAKAVPRNLRITFSCLYSPRYCTFNGTQTRYGRIENIYNFLNGE